LVSHELIRVAILWHELWHEGLEEASRLYFTDKNPEGMIEVLKPLHEKLEAVSLSPLVDLALHLH
jgi:FKBP12-rapamycin complex-associated protein